MGWNGSGSFIRNDGTLTGSAICATQKATGVGAVASRFDNELNEIATGLQACVTKNGESGALTANLNAGSQKIVNLANGTASGEALHFGQLAISSWTPSYNTSPTGGSISASTTDNARFVRLGNIVLFTLKASFTISGGVSANAILFSLPVAAVNINQGFAAQTNFTGLSTLKPGLGILVDVNTVSVVEVNNSGGYQNISAGAGRVIVCSGFYEAA